MVIEKGIQLTLMKELKTVFIGDFPFNHGKWDFNQVK